MPRYHQSEEFISYTSLHTVYIHQCMASGDIDKSYCECTQQ